MADDTNAAIVAVFHDLAQAKRAYSELRSGGFGDDYLGFADPTQSGSGLGKSLEYAGVSKEDNAFYNREFDAGHPIVTVRIGGAPKEAIQKAIDILRRNGAYDARSGQQKGHFASNVNTEAKTPFYDIAPNTPDNR